ncbi:cytochrome P450-dit2 [Ceratobasidium sp. 370]|nr:cytochrome P450-dit2 [Ceratobasidium sp. 370]
MGILPPNVAFWLRWAWDMLFVERQSAKLEALLQNRAADVWAIEALSTLVTHSLQEDPYGRVQRDIPRVLEALVSYLGALEQLVEETNATPTPNTEDTIKTVVQPVAEALREGIRMIVLEFGPRLTAFTFPPRVAKRLQTMFNRRDKLLVELPGPPKERWVTGHFKKFFGPDGALYQENLVARYGTTVKINGAFGEEAIWTLDPVAMHSILVKDRANFERPAGVTLMIRSIFGGGLLEMTGDKHRMPIFMDIAEQTCKGIKKDLSNVRDSSKEVDVFPWMTAAALELIGEAGLGYSFSSFAGERNEYNVAIKSVMQFLSKAGPFIKMLPTLYNFGTPAFRRWALSYIPVRNIQQLLHAVRIQNNQAEEVLRARQALIASGHDLSSEAGRGRDIMTLLMKANEAETSENYIDRQELVGHMNVFVFAGHETTRYFGKTTKVLAHPDIDHASTAVSRILDVLANRPQIQVKLREEIRLYFEEHKDDINHDALLELPYLDAVVRETLRLYGPVVQLTRVNQEDTVIPLQYPVETPNGKLSGIPVKKGTRILLSIAMANRYGKIWGERAHEFWPERWVGNKLDEVTQPGAHLPGVYSSMMTFGAGPTSCIGFKFALLETSTPEVMIAALVKSFKFEPSQQELSHWEAFSIQFPYLKREQGNADKVPKLPLRVIEL